MFHDTGQDVSEARQPNDTQTRALQLLDLPHAGRVRLSLETWRRVDRIAAALEDTRNALSAPRSASDQPTHVPTPQGSPGATQGDE